jgi:hypothetical protein
MKKKKKVIYDEESIEFTESTESIGSSLADDDKVVHGRRAIRHVEVT